MKRTNEEFFESMKLLLNYHGPEKNIKVETKSANALKTVFNTSVWDYDDESVTSKRIEASKQMSEAFKDGITDSPKLAIANELLRQVDEESNKYIPYGRVECTYIPSNNLNSKGARIIDFYDMEEKVQSFTFDLEEMIDSVFHYVPKYFDQLNRKYSK